MNKDVLAILQPRMFPSNYVDVRLSAERWATLSLEEAIAFRDTHAELAAKALGCHRGRLNWTTNYDPLSGEIVHTFTRHDV